VTELVETFRGALVNSFTEHLSGHPAGIISIVASAASRPASTRVALHRAGPFADPPAALTAATYIRISSETGNEGPDYAVTAVQLTQAATGAPIDLSFTSPSLPLLNSIFQAQDTAVRIPALRLWARARADGHRSGTVLTGTFSGLSVGSFAENLSGAVSGTATLVARVKRTSGGV